MPIKFLSKGKKSEQGAGAPNGASSSTVVNMPQKQPSEVKRNPFLVEQSKSSEKCLEKTNDVFVEGRRGSGAIKTQGKTRQEKTQRKSSVSQESQKSSLTKRSKSQQSTNHSKAVLTKQKSAVESPFKKLNKKLLNLVAELRQSNEFYQHELKKAQGANLHIIFRLEKENELLSRENVKQSNDLEKWRRRCNDLEDKNVPFTKVKILSKENEDLKQDLQVSKSVVCRLNTELLTYQEKLGRVISMDDDEDFRVTSDSDEHGGPDFMEKAMKHPRKNFLPLLFAYDEVIKEKDEIISDYENVLKKFKSYCQEIVRENQQLHITISDQQEKGTISVEEWEFLHANALVVLEENDILNEKIELLKKKEDLMIKTHKERVQNVKVKITKLEEDKRELTDALSKTEIQCKHLLEQQNRLSEILEKRIPLDQHEASVNQCKELFEQLKINYNSERTILMEKLEASEKERHRLVEEIGEFEALNGRLQSSIDIVESTMASNVAQFREVYSKMIEATKEKDASTSAMEETMILSQRILEDRENTERLLQEQRMLNDNLVQLREKQSSLVSELHQKIQEMEDVHAREILNYRQKMQDLESHRELIKLEHQQKLTYLENLSEERSKRIEQLETENKQLQIVWKTTTSSMKNISDSLLH